MKKYKVTFKNSLLGIYVRYYKSKNIPALIGELAGDAYAIWEIIEIKQVEHFPENIEATYNGNA